MSEKQPISITLVLLDEGDANNALVTVGYQGAKEVKISLVSLSEVELGPTVGEMVMAVEQWREEASKLSATAKQSAKEHKKDKKVAPSPAKTEQVQQPASDSTQLTIFSQEKGI